MRIVLDIHTSLEENASRYYEKAKKAKKKAAGAREALERTKGRMKEREHEDEKTLRRKETKKEWYEKFRWFISSQDVLCIGGRDANTNEAIVKKHAEKNETVFHTDMAGSPFVIVKSDSPGSATLDEAAQFTASYSRAWKNGYAELEVFSVKPDQLSKQAQPGEYLGKGGFMVRGHVEYRRARIALAVGSLPDGRIMAGPHSAVQSNCSTGYEVLQGNEKTSDVAKRLAKLLDCHPDEIIQVLPPGGVKMGRRIKE